MDARPRLLIVGARGIGGSEGGVEKFAEEFVGRMAGCCRLTLLCLTGRVRDNRGDIEIITVPRSNFMHTDKLFYYLAALWVCLTRRFDHVVLLGLNSAMLVLPLRLAFWRRPNLVVRSGSIDYVLDKWGVASKLYFRLAEHQLRFADLVVAVAPSIQRHLARRGIRSVVIPNGLNIVAAPQPLEGRGRRQVVAVGRITAQKNYALLVEAANLLRGRDIMFTIVGGADLSPEALRLRTLMDRHTVTNLVFAGAMERSKVLEHVSRTSLYVNCSIHEGMSNSVLEAIQQGTPVLLSDIEANRDFQLPDEFYFDPRSPVDLARKIELALESPGRFLVARSGFEDWDAIIEKYRRYMALPALGAVDPAARPVLS